MSFPLRFPDISLIPYPGNQKLVQDLTRSVWLEDTWEQLFNLSKILIKLKEIRGNLLKSEQKRIESVFLITSKSPTSLNLHVL